MSAEVSRDGAAVLVAKWEPSRHLRGVRHQVNNLLAPVVVAAELLDDGSETAELLTRSVARLRDVSNRMRELLHLGLPIPRSTTLGDLAAVCGLVVPFGHHDRLLLVDPERLLANVVSELAALSIEHASEVSDPSGSQVADPSPASCSIVASPRGAGEALRVAFVLPARINPEDPDDLAVPFALPGVDVRLATVCRETVLQGGLVGYEAEIRTLVLYLPLI